MVGKALLIVGAWLPLLMTVWTVWFAARLLFVPAGAYGAWRRAWGWLMLGVVSIGLLWLRNALTVSGLMPETSWLIQVLLNIPLRITVSTLSALGFLGCTYECYQIFRQRPLSVPIPVAQVVMNWRGTILLWNAAATNLLGWTEEDAVGHVLADLIIPEELMVDYHGTSIPAREAHQAGLKHFHETGESGIMATRFSTVALHKDGHRVEVEVRVNAHMTSLGQTFLGQLTLLPPGVA